MQAWRSPRGDSIVSVLIFSFISFCSLPAGVKVCLWVLKTKIKAHYLWLQTTGTRAGQMDNWQVSLRVNWGWLRVKQKNPPSLYKTVQKHWCKCADVGHGYSVNLPAPTLMVTRGMAPFLHICISSLPSALICVHVLPIREVAWGLENSSHWQRQQSTLSAQEFIVR